MREDREAVEEVASSAQQMATSAQQATASLPRAAKRWHRRWRA